MRNVFSLAGRSYIQYKKGNKELYQPVTVKENLKFPSELLIIIIIIIIIIILAITFMQGIYNYKAETNHVSGV